MKLGLLDRINAFLAASDLRAAHRRYGKMAARGIGTSFALGNENAVTIYTSYPGEVKELLKFIDTMGDRGGEDAE